MENIKVTKLAFYVVPALASFLLANALSGSGLATNPQGQHNNKHVLLLSVDGLREADVEDPNLAGDLTNTLKLAKSGVTYTNAATSKPSDSFPGTLAYLTGAGPKTTGVYYDDSYARDLIAPGGNVSTPLGTEAEFAENIDKDSTLLNGGGDFRVGSIDPTKLPLDSNGNSVYPHNYVKVNTIFNVAHDAGLYTAFSDKHPAYDIANGPSGNGVDDFYAPEINASVALEDGKLVDASTAKDPSKLTFTTTTNNYKLTEAYDDLKVNAILNEIKGSNSQGTAVMVVPAIFGMNFQAVSVAEKDLANGGINADGTPSAELEDAIKHTDQSIGKIVNALKQNHLFDSTLVVLTAKHGQNPRVGAATLLKDSVYTDALKNAGIKVAQATQDDIALLWLDDQTQAGDAANILNSLKASNPEIDTVLAGDDLQKAGFGNPHDGRTPDLIVKLKPAYVLVGNPATSNKRAEHGGLSSDDTHVPLILGGDNLAVRVRAKKQTQQVNTAQIAVTALEALGLNPANLQGAVAENTQPLPGFKREERRNYAW